MNHIQCWIVHSEPLVLHVGNICAPPPGKTRRCQQCAKAPAEIAPSPSNTIGTLEKPKSFSLNLLLGELPTLHQIKTVQYWFRSGNGLNHEADSAKKPQAAVKLAMSNNNSCRNTPAHESTRQTQCHKHCRQFLFDWFGWSRKPQSAAQAPDHFKDTVWEVQDNACNSPCLAPRQWLSSQRLGQYNKKIYWRKQRKDAKGHWNFWVAVPLNIREGE